jgi:hypothetical protein
MKSADTGGGREVSRVRFGFQLDLFEELGDRLDDDSGGEIRPVHERPEMFPVSRE